MRSSCLLAVLVAAVHAMPAAAAPAALGDGRLPGVTVAADGTAYVAWLGPGTPSPLRFCRLPRGAGACDPAATAMIAAPGDSGARPFVVVSGSTVVVVQYRYGEGVPGFGALYAFTSADSGTGFGPGAVIGKQPFMDAVEGPGATLSGVTNAETAGTAYQDAPLRGAPVAADGTSTVGSALLSGDHPYDGSVAVIDRTTPIASFADGAGNHQFRVYDGSGDVNDAANWTPAADLGSYGAVRLASGPAGTWMLAATSGQEIVARRFDGAAFGAPAPVGVIGDPATLHAFEDGAGRLHVVASRGAADGVHLDYAVSDDGRSWRSQSVVTQTDGGIGDLRVSAAPDHEGAAAFSTGGHVVVTPLAQSGPPPPKLGETANVAPLSGRVRVRPPGSPFARLTGATQIETGSLIDARRGTLELVAATATAGRTQSARLSGGVFRVSQARRGVDKGLTTFALKLGGFKGAPTYRQCRAGSAGARASRVSRKTLQALRARDRHGRFRTRGHYSAGTVRGTTWITEERCDGTLIKVRSGAVVVSDLGPVTGGGGGGGPAPAPAPTVTVVRAGHSHLARRRG